MEWFRWQQNPWGQNILRGMDWDVTWLAVAAAGLFMAAHLGLCLWRWRRLAEPDAAPDDGVPERVPRHSLPSRLFHWTMAASVFVLLFTSFLPIIGVNFSLGDAALDRRPGAHRCYCLSRGSRHVLERLTLDVDHP